MMGLEGHVKLVGGTKNVYSICRKSPKDGTTWDTNAKLEI
jgi:hypothetical protein